MGAIVTATAAAATGTSATAGAVATPAAAGVVASAPPVPAKQKLTKQQERKAEKAELYQKPFKKSYKQAAKDGLTVKIYSTNPDHQMSTEDFVTIEIQLMDFADELFEDNADIDLGDNGMSPDHYVWYEARNQETYVFLVEYVPKIIPLEKPPPPPVSPKAGDNSTPPIPAPPSKQTQEYRYQGRIQGGGQGPNFVRGGAQRGAGPPPPGHFRNCGIRN